MLECTGVQCAYAVSGNSVLILDHQREFGFEDGVRRSVDMTEQFRVEELARGVGAAIAGCEGNGVERVEIGGRIIADDRHVMCVGHWWGY